MFRLAFLFFAIAFFSHSNSYAQNYRFSGIISNITNESPIYNDCCGLSIIKPGTLEVGNAFSITFKAKAGSIFRAVDFGEPGFPDVMSRLSFSVATRGLNGNFNEFSNPFPTYSNCWTGGTCLSVNQEDFRTGNYNFDMRSIHGFPGVDICAFYVGFYNCNSTNPISLFNSEAYWTEVSNISNGIDDNKMNIKLYGYNDYSGGLEIFIDNVEVSEVPEPHTWLMLIVGFGLCGQAARHVRSLNSKG